MLVKHCKKYTLLLSTYRSCHTHSHHISLFFYNNITNDDSRRNGLPTIFPNAMSQFFPNTISLQYFLTTLVPLQH